MNRPSFVAPDFAGKCKIFPQRDVMLLPYQERWIKDNARIKLCVKSRQIGMSFATGYGLVRQKIREDARLDAWVSSRDETQAILFLETVKRFVAVFNAAAEDQGQPLVDDLGPTFVVRLSNGRRIHSMSSNEAAQAGKVGDRVLDEFALHQNNRRLYATAYGGITVGGQLIIFSTHRGTANFFYQLIIEAEHKGNPKKISLHRVSLQNALEEGFLYKLQCKLPPDDERIQMDEAEYFDYIRAGAPDPETFLEEFMCTPSDDASAFLSYELLDSCKYPPNKKWQMSLDELRECKDPLYLGADIARTKNLTVFWIVKAVADFRPTVHRVALQNVPFAEQEARLYELLELQSLRRACIDCTGLGRQLCENAQRRFRYKVEPITFTLAVKEMLAFPLRSAFEDRTVRIPDDPKIIASHRAISKETTASGNVRFVAESNDANHADDFWAHSLALHAAKPVGTGAISDPSKIRYGHNAGSLLAPRPVFKPRTLQQRPRIGYFQT